MTDLEIFKRHVGYSVKADQDTFTGNGATVTVNLRHENVSDVEVYVADDLLAAGTYVVAAEPGVITFNDAPPDGAVVTVNYQFAPFTDTEALALIDEYGLQKAVIEALREILANQARMRNYKQGDTEVDNSQVFKQIRELLKIYEDELYKDQSSVNPITIGIRSDPRGSSDYCQEQDISRLYG